MLTIAESWSAASRIGFAAEFLDRYPPATEILVLGASRSAADDFVRQHCASNRATFGLHRLSFLQVAARLALERLAQTGSTPSAPAGEESLAWRSIFGATGKAKLKHFSALAQRPGFARSLARTLTEVRLSGVKPEEVLAAGEGVVAEFGELLTEYEAELERYNINDRAKLFETALASLRDSSNHLYADCPVILLDIPITSNAERELAVELCSRAPEALATIPSGDERTLKALGEASGAEHRVAGSPVENALDRLQRYVFTDVPSGDYSHDDCVCFFSAPGEGRECVEIVRRLIDEARRGLRFDQMAIVLRAPHIYGALLETALERAGVPAFFALGTRRPDPAGRAFLVLLTCAIEGLSAKRFAEYLSLAQVPQLDETGAPPQDRNIWVHAYDDILSATLPEREDLEVQVEAEGADEEGPVLAGSLRAPWRWEELLVEAAVIGGVARWQRRLDGLEAELKLKLHRLSAEEPDSGLVRSIERQVRDVQHLRNFALPVIESLAAMPGETTWGEWLEVLEKLAPMVLRRPERVLEVLAEFRPMADIGPVSLEEVRQVLSQRLTQLQVKPPRDRYGRVFIGTPDHLRGHVFNIVFVPGLAERIFPQRPHEDPILLDRVRNQITVGGLSLRKQADRVQSERLQLRLATGAASQRIYLSYPRFEVAMARPRVPSFYALDVKRTLSGTVPGVDEFEREAAQESQALLAWPAPPKPEEAIDDFEHDLSILGPLLLEDPTKVTGRAHYLLTLNSCLGRSLRARRAQWRSAWRVGDGLCVNSEETRNALAGHRLTARAYSPTTLQHFAICPYRFLLAGIHRLEVRQDTVPLQYMDPLTKGSLVHAVLARFARHMLEEAGFPITKAGLNRANALLDASLDAIALDFRERLAPAIERVWQDEIDRVRGDLRGWLLRIAEEEDDWSPVFIEFAFGLPVEQGRDPASTEAAAVLSAGYRLRGIIDCVERKVSTGALRVTDYKTGKNRLSDNTLIHGGEVLQTVMYPTALEAMGHGPVTQARLEFCTADGSFSTSVVPFDATARAAADQILATVDQAIETAFLPPAPRKDACQWCDFKVVCGPYEELRVTRKDQTPLVQLQALRKMP